MAGADDIIAKATARKVQLHQRLAAQPLVSVCGVVHAGGASGGRMGSEKLWTMTFKFDAWRVEDAAVQKKRALLVHQEVSEEAVRPLMDRIKAGAVLRIKARVLDDLAADRADALLMEIIGENSPDAELLAVAEELQKPVTYEDNVFGVLTLDRRYTWYQGEAEWCGTKVKVHLSAETTEELQTGLKTAHQLWAEQTAWNTRIREYTLTELLALKNGTWLEDGEAELTEEEFWNKVTLETVGLNPEGKFEFWYDDGNLFWGHSIMVSGTLEGGLDDAGIHG